jgi:hypothetical protein
VYEINLSYKKKGEPMVKKVTKRSAAKRKSVKRAAPKRKVAKKAAKRKSVKRAAPKRKVAKKAAPKRRVAKKAAVKRRVAKVVKKAGVLKKKIGKELKQLESLVLRPMKRVAPRRK